MTALASISGPLVAAATHVIADLGLAGVFVLMLLESACIPIPSEATMLFAGFGVAHGRFDLVAVTTAGVAGNVVGSWLAFAAGAYGRTALGRRRHGPVPAHAAANLRRAQRFFDRHGTRAVLLARLLPLVRTFISLPAGAARMPLMRFSVLTSIGCIPWVLALTILGRQAGSSWRHWENNLQYLDYAVVALLAVTVVTILVRRRRHV